MRSLAKLCLIALPAVLLTLALLELVVFRRWIAVGDVPVEDYDAVHRLLRYRPEQHGASYPDDDLRHPVPFTVNVDGWNSLHRRYEVAKGSKLRIAVVGDSYVAAFEVTPRLSLAGQLEAALGEENAEVYSFGVRGAPLSQYLQMARHVVATYRPEVLVVVIVHNDFVESYRPPPGRYTRSFLHLRVGTDGGAVEEVPPRPYREPGPQQWIRSHSSAFRFFFYRAQVGSQRLRRLYSALTADPPRYQANVDVTELVGETDRMRAVTRYVFAEFAKLERASGTRFLLVADAPRAAIYDGSDPRRTEAYEPNRIAEQAATAAGLPLIDLTPDFERDYRRHRARFEFPHDGHWNARGHRVAAEAVRRSLERHPVDRRGS
ncbi:MAG: SGNH/GDSL hydrolase family protein [Deltaproteobacteria bacterium]|nr:SGNH/GDSL hydrolase family protein [Deltaproteobacteria bacterium]